MSLSFSSFIQRQALARRLRGCAAVLASSVGLLWVAPAAAVPGMVLVTSAQTATDSSSTKTVDAVCPTGKKVYSVGGFITVATGGSGKTMLTQAFPDSTLSKVTVTAAEDATAGFTGTWALTAQAICGEPVANLHREKFTVASSVSDGKNGIQQCASGTLYGLGFAIQGASGKIFLNSIRHEGSNSILGYRATADNVPFGTAWGLDVMGICGDAAPGYERVNSFGTGSSTSSQTVTRGCPGDKKIHGAGFNLGATARSDVLVEDWNYANLFSVQVKMVENDATAENWGIDQTLICAN